jgi:predicted dehydrogenase
MTPVRVCLVGLGGFGNEYVDALLDNNLSSQVELVGAVDPAPDGCRRLAEVAARTGRIHESIHTFYEERETDLVVICAPIHFHAPITIAALEHGSHVLCEKPVAAVVQDALAMATAADRAGRSVAIGFQWSFSDTIQAIRRDVAAGRFGEPLLLRALVLWPRPDSYYKRNSWVGTVKSTSGEWVLDSPVSNATAHYLHNAFFVLGEAGRPVSVQGELYRVRRIESFDTAAIRVTTECGAEVLYYTSHVVRSNLDPVIHYRFSKADLYSQGSGSFVARFDDGSTVDYGTPGIGTRGKLLRAIRDVSSGAPPACSIADALGHLVAACGSLESSQIAAFPEEVTRHSSPGSPDNLVSVDQLPEILSQCFAQGILPAEHGGIVWANAGSEFDLREYREYPARQSQ